jgi:hypothetical protein
VSHIPKFGDAVVSEWGCPMSFTDAHPPARDAASPNFWMCGTAEFIIPNQLVRFCRDKCFRMVNRFLCLQIEKILEGLFALKINLIFVNI